jgi:hypothetical protein
MSNQGVVNCVYRESDRIFQIIQPHPTLRTVDGPVRIETMTGAGVCCATAPNLPDKSTNLQLTCQHVASPPDHSSLVQCPCRS